MNRMRSGRAGLGVGVERAVRGRRLAEVDAVGHDPVAPAVEAPRGPGGGLGDGDADVQAVHPPPRAEQRCAMPLVRAFSE